MAMGTTGVTWFKDCLRVVWVPLWDPLGSRSGTGGVPLWDGSTSGLVPLWDPLLFFDTGRRAETASRFMAYSTVAPLAHFRVPVCTKMPSATNSLQVRITVDRPNSISSAIVCLDAQIPDPSSLARSAIYPRTAFLTALPATLE